MIRVSIKQKLQKEEEEEKLRTNKSYQKLYANNTNTYTILKNQFNENLQKVGWEMGNRSTMIRKIKDLLRNAININNRNSKKS